MSEMDNRVTLTVNNMEYGGWKSVQITCLLYTSDAADE